MGGLKFSCWPCGQHIAADGAWRGQKLNCSACQRELVVPNARTLPIPAPTRPALAAMPPVIRETPRSPSPPASQSGKTSLCGLALISVLLVVITPLVAFIQTALMPVVPLAPVCLLACLICGHLALHRVRSLRCIHQERLDSYCAVTTPTT